MLGEFRKDIKDYLSGHLIPPAINLAYIAIFTRIFPPSAYGKFILLMVTINFCFNLSSTWIYNGIIRFYPEEKEKISKILFLLTLLSSLPFIFIFFFFEGIYFKLGALLFILKSIFDNSLAFLQAQRKAKKFSAMQIAYSCLNLIFSFIFVKFLRIGLNGLVMGGIFAVLVLLFMLKEVKIEFYFEKKIAKAMLNYGVPLTFSNLFSLSLIYIDRYFINFFLSEKEVGIYSVSYTLAERFIILLTSLFVTASRPICFQLYTKSKEQAVKYNKKILKIFVVIGLCLTLLIITFSKLILKIFAGKEFWEGITIFPYITFSAFFFGLQKISETFILLEKKTKILLFIFMIACFLNIALNFVLIPKFGITGAAISTFIAYLTLFILTAINS